MQTYKIAATQTLFNLVPFFPSIKTLFILWAYVQYGIPMDDATIMAAFYVSIVLVWQNLLAADMKFRP